MFEIEFCEKSAQEYKYGVIYDNDRLVTTR